MKKNLLLTSLIFASFSCAPLSGHAQLGDLLGSIPQKFTKSDSNDHQNSSQTKKNNQSAKPRMSCASILNSVKKDDKQYTEDELIKLFSSINASCKSNELDNFKYTSIGALVSYIENCRTYVYWIKSDEQSIISHNQTESLKFCAKISSNEDKNLINNHLKSFDQKIDRSLKKEYPDAEDRAIILKQRKTQMLENDKRWRGGFEARVSIQWMPYSGYIIAGGDAIDEEDVIKNLPKNIKCSPTSQTGISYCGKISARSSTAFVKAQLPLFRVENQKFNIFARKDFYNHKLELHINNRPLRNAILELRLDPDNKLSFIIDEKSFIKNQH